MTGEVRSISDRRRYLPAYDYRAAGYPARIVPHDYRQARDTLRMNGDLRSITAAPSKDAAVHAAAAALGFHDVAGHYHPWFDADDVAGALIVWHERRPAS